jgi:glutamate synthase (NADPH/NADH) large chain
MQYNLLINNWIKNKQKLVKNHVYDELNEHSSCGVGLIASLQGIPKREVVEMGIEALKCLYHRGAVDADGKTFKSFDTHFNHFSFRYALQRCD